MKPALVVLMIALAGCMGTPPPQGEGGQPGPASPAADATSEATGVAGSPSGGSMIYLPFTTMSGSRMWQEWAADQPRDPWFSNKPFDPPPVLQVGEEDLIWVNITRNADDGPMQADLVLDISDGLEIVQGRANETITVSGPTRYEWTIRAVLPGTWPLDIRVSGERHTQTQHGNVTVVEGPEAQAMGEAGPASDGSIHLPFTISMGSRMWEKWGAAQPEDRWYANKPRDPPPTLKVGEDDIVWVNITRDAKHRDTFDVEVVLNASEGLEIVEGRAHDTVTVSGAERYTWTIRAVAPGTWPLDVRVSGAKHEQTHDWSIIVEAQ